MTGRNLPPSGGRGRQSPILQSFGGDLINRDTYSTAQGVLNGPEALAWANWMHGLVENGYIARRSGEDSTLGFINGKSAPSCGPGAGPPTR
jgi:multiple sugar transport system substrate-binding protein